MDSENCSLKKGPIMKIFFAFFSFFTISICANADLIHQELKTIDCHASPESRGTGTSYILYKRYSGSNSKQLAEMQDIQVVVGNMNGSGLALEKFTLLSVERSDWDGRFLVIGKHKTDKSKSIRIILHPKLGKNGEPIPFEYRGMISSDDYGNPSVIGADFLNCWVSDGEAN